MKKYTQICPKIGPNDHVVQIATSNDLESFRLENYSDFALKKYSILHHNIFLMSFLQQSSPIFMKKCIQICPKIGQNDHVAQIATSNDLESFCLEDISDFALKKYNILHFNICLRCNKHIFIKLDVLGQVGCARTCQTC